MESIREEGRDLPVIGSHDVVVAGAGLSGCAAAISAARSGADVLLIERHGFPGGTSTAGLMSGITNFYYTGKDRHVATGIAQEVVDRLEARKATGSGPFTHEVPQIPNDPEVMKLVLIELLDESGVQVLFHTFVASTRVEDGCLTHLVLQSKGGRVGVGGRAFVDATGDADLAWMSGAEVEPLGANGSLEIRMANVDIDALLESLLARPEEYDDYGDVETSLADCRQNWMEKGIFHLPHGNGRKLSVVQNAISRGEYPREVGVIHGLDAFGMYAFRGDETIIVNTGFVNGPLLDPTFLSRAEMDARKAARIAADFLKERMPGFGQAYLSQTAPEIGIRLTRRISGRYTLSEEDISSYRRFDDVVAVATERQVGGPRFEEGFDVPYRILLPVGVEGLLVASGKCVSTQPAGRLRGQVACMQMGQACGVAAAIAASSGVPPSGVELRLAQRELLRQGIYLGENDRLRELDLV